MTPQQHHSAGQSEALHGAVRDVMQSIRVLFVDDNILCCRIGHRMLTELGVEVHCATSSDDALAMAQSHEFDVIVLDSVMPKMSGLDLADRLRVTGESYQSTPRIVLTTTDGEGVGDRQAAKKAGVAGVLSKPLSRGSIMEALMPGR